MGGVLDLSGADTSGFDAMPSGRYLASVFEAEMRETKGNPGAKLPAGVPMLYIQWKVEERLDDPSDEANYDNRRQFSNFPIPTDEQSENAAKLKGGLVRALVALGVGDEAEVTSKKFNLEVEDLIGRQAEILVGQQPSRDDADVMTNNVKGIKAVGSGAAATPGIL